MHQPTIATLDVRHVVPRERHPLIFSTFEDLPSGRAMELVNDHDPKPLFFHLQSDMPGKFKWDYLQAGPDVWRVKITKLANMASTGQCCGHCGGG
jgi:uncharacterized protein (DUF2249 family)